MSAKVINSRLFAQGSSLVVLAAGHSRNYANTKYTGDPSEFMTLPMQTSCVF